MGANSIDISQYRSRIGTFAGKKIKCSTRRASCGVGLTASNVMDSFIMLSCLLVLSDIAQQLLIISGVELNPGPNSLGKTYFFIYLQIFYIDTIKLCLIFLLYS